MKQPNRWLIGLGVVTLLVLAFVPPIRQWTSYHDFADRRTIAGIPNAMDVVSNLPFELVGIAGLLRAKTRIWRTFFFGTILCGIGSTYYHLMPDNARLVWDRLPMTFAFAAFFAGLVTDRIDERAGNLWFLTMLVGGIASVMYWRATNDLRWYGWVQFFPMIAGILLVCFCRARQISTRDVTILFGCYALAKVCEVADAPVLQLTGVVSGHTLKHLFAAAGAAWMIPSTRRVQ